jgi:hypothetical protein
MLMRGSASAIFPFSNINNMFRKVLVLLVLVAVAIQFIRPDRNNPKVNPAEDLVAVANPPAEVQSILKNACYDCHSNESVWPWYTNITPVNWFVANHIKEGREKLNFSTFGSLSAAERSEALGEAAETIQEGEMPLESYTLLHPEAKLNATQRQTLLNWLQANGEQEGGAGNGGKTEEKTENDED